MLNPTSDRLDYGEIIAPPAGYEVVSAIGTTYSLDFDALVGVCIALGLSENIDSILLNNPIYLLETLRKIGDKVALFCEAGQIHVPPNQSALYILLEKIVYEVKVKNQKTQPFNPSFHPKFWIFKYSDKQNKFLYRIIVLSRNLTFDRSWDVAISVQGEPVLNTSEKTKPIVDFLNYLLMFLNGSSDNIKIKRKLIRDMIFDINKVEFKTNLREFTDIDFIPVGIKRNNIEKYNIKDYPLFNDTFHEAFIMSPFLSDSIVNDFNCRNKAITNPKCILITRRVSLEKLKPEHCDKFQLFTMKDVIVEGESMLSEEGSQTSRQDIHAKLYLWRKHSDTELYIGSLNASHSALNGNIEFMLRLKSKNRYVNTELLLKSLFCGEIDNPDNPFELTKLPNEITEENIINDTLEKKIKLLCRGICHASVHNKGDKYSIEISFDRIIDMDGLFIAPLLSNKNEPISTIVNIEGLNLLQISEFYRITAEKDNVRVQRIIKIPTDNIPGNRESAVVNDVIKDKHCFYQYISFLLGDDYLLSAIETNIIQKSGVYNYGIQAQIPALYERMLRTAATEPKRFAEIDYIIKMTKDKGVIPDGFTELYETFKKAVGLRD